jgi:uncharacterized protein involved in exopolysaccharide biosynthesis
VSEREIVDVQATPPEFEYYGEEPEGQPLHVSVGVLFSKLELLWAHRRWIFRRTLVAMVLALAVTLVLPNRYTATIFLNPPDSNPMSGLTMLMGLKSGGAAGALGGQMSDVLGLKDPGQLYVQQLLSRSVLDSIIARFDLQKVYRTKTRYSTRKALVANTDVQEDRKSGALQISVEDKDPKRAAQMANAYAEELGRLIANVNSASGRREREYFQAQLLASQGDLEQASKQLSEFGSKNTTLDVGEQGKALVEAVANIEGQLIAAESELKSLLQIYTEKHERVQQTRAKIAVLRRQLEQISGKQPTSGAKSGGNPGDGASPLDPSVKRLWGLSVPYMDLYRRVKVQEAVVETLTQQYELAKLQEARQVSDIQVFDPADVPERKSSPHRLLITLAVGMLAFLSTCGFVLASAWWTEADPQDPWRTVLEPVVLRLGNAGRRTKLRFSPTRIGFVRKMRERNHSVPQEEEQPQL